MSTSRIQATDVTEHLRDRLRAAEEIWLVDPDHGMGQDDKHQWMELIVSVPPPVPDVVDPAAMQSEPLILEVAVDAANLDQLVEIRERIKRLCGAPSLELPRQDGSESP